MGSTLREAARALLNHTLALPDEDEAAEKLRLMGLESPTGADAMLLGQYLKALRGDTAAAKFVRDAAAEAAPPEPEAIAFEDLKSLPDDALYALLAEAAP